MDGGVVMRPILIKLAAGVIAVMMSFCNIGYAEFHNVTAVGEYEMGEADTILVAKERALDDAKRNAAEQMTSYIESETVVENNVVTKDTIILMTAQFIRINGEPVWSRTSIGDFGTKLVVTINACVDDTDINVLRNRISDKTLSKKYEELQLNYERIQNENKKLKLQLEQARTEPERTKVANELLANGDVYLANKYITEFENYTVSDCDIQKSEELLRKAHEYLDNNLSLPSAIMPYLKLGTNELTLESYREKRTIEYYGVRLKGTGNINQKRQIRKEYNINVISQAKKYDDIANRYIKYVEMLPYNKVYEYDKYGAMVIFWGFRGIALKMKGNDNEAYKCVERAKDYLSLIPKTSKLYGKSDEVLQTIKENIALRGYWGSVKGAVR